MQRVHTAASKGIAPAQFQLGMYHFEQEEWHWAEQWLAKAAEQGFSGAVDYLQQARNRLESE